MKAVGFGWRSPDVAVELRADADASAEHLARLVDDVPRLFPTYLRDGDAARRVEVRLARSGAHVLAAGETCVAEGVPDTLAAVEIAVTRALLEAAPHPVRLHASGAVVRGRAVLALGAAGSGKSSLALAWMLRGRPLLGDDTVLLGEDGRAHPFHRLLKIHQDVAEHAGLRLEETLGWDPDNEEVWVSPRAEGWARAPVPVGVVARVRFLEGAELRVRPLSTSDTLNLLLHSVLAGGAGAATGFDALTAVAARARGVDVVFSDPDGAAHYLESV